MNEIYWVEDGMSKGVLDNRYYSTKEEAVARRNEIGYGLVKSRHIAAKNGPIPASREEPARRSDDEIDHGE